MLVQNLTDFNWAIYPGNWGAQLQLPAITFECINKARESGGGVACARLPETRSC